MTPPGFNVRTTVHEYGGGAYLLHDASRLLLELRGPTAVPAGAGGDPVADHPRTRRPAAGATPDMDLSPDGGGSAVRERHPEPEELSGVVNELVVIPADGSSMPALASGRDFYAFPRWSPDGSRLCCITWGPPVDALGRHRAARGRSRARRIRGRVRAVAGRAAEESIFQPAWSPDGELTFVSDRTGWWNLYREARRRA